MIDRHYGHLARDGRELAIKLLDALNAPELAPWTLVDARWTPEQENDVNPAKVGVDNPIRRRKEQHPFESWAELEAIAAAIGPRYGPMILFAAATGLRPAEWIALETRDIDRTERVVYVRRSFTRVS